MTPFDPSNPKRRVALAGSVLWLAIVVASSAGCESKSSASPPISGEEPVGMCAPPEPEAPQATAAPDCVAPGSGRAPLDKVMGQCCGGPVCPGEKGGCGCAVANCGICGS